MQRILCCMLKYLARFKKKKKIQTRRITMCRILLSCMHTVAADWSSFSQWCKNHHIYCPSINSVHEVISMISLMSSFVILSDSSHPYTTTSLLSTERSMLSPHRKHYNNHLLQHSPIYFLDPWTGYRKCLKSDSGLPRAEKATFIVRTIQLHLGICSQPNAN